MSSTPFAIQGVKIPMFNLPGAYDDLYGRTLDTSRYESWSSVLDSIKASGANDVMLIISAGVMPSTTANDFDPKLSVSPERETIRKLAEQIKALGMTVSISAFVNVDNLISGAGGDDRPNPADRQAWLGNYTKVIVDMARFAEDIGAWAFLPLEDVTMHLVRDPVLTPGYLDLIAQVRSVFSGKLSTTWFTSGRDNDLLSLPWEIIEQHDYIGVGFFPELTNDENASVAALEQGYYNDREGHDTIEALRQLSELFNKPVWITDKAFHSFDGSVHDHNRIFDSSVPVTVDFEEQARLYESFLRVMSREAGDWMMGVSFQSFNNVRDDVDMLARFTNGPLSESPQGKPAYDVMKAWFSAPVQGEGLTRTVSFADNKLGGGWHHDVLSGGLGNDLVEGFAGNDMLIGGPATLGNANVLQVEVYLRGVKSYDVSPIVGIVDAYGHMIEVAEVDAQLVIGGPLSGPPTRIAFHVDAANPNFRIDALNWGFFGMGASDNRVVRIDGIRVNGTPLNLPSAVFYDAPVGRPDRAGQVDAVQGGSFLITVPDGFTPIALAVGDDDTLRGGEGDDTLDGGAGLDTALFAGNRAEYLVTKQGDTLHVSGPDGNDTLTSVERLRFDDSSIAFDLDGNAGFTARVIGAVFGKAQVANKQYVGIGLGLLDSGMDQQALMKLALQTRLGASATNADVVNLLYTNVVGQPPDAASFNYFKDMLDSGAISQAGLGVVAANHALNAAGIDLVGLAASGIEYL